MGYDSLISDLDMTDWATSKDCQVLREELEAAADVYIEAERVICTWAMGITQQPGAVDTIQTLVNLLLMRGNIGRPGQGYVPYAGILMYKVIEQWGSENPKSDFWMR